MIKASSLFYALVISLLIAIVSSSLILFASLSRIEFDSFQMNQRIQLNVDSGMQLLMSQQSLVEINQQNTLDLFGMGEDSVLLARKSWGAYEVITAKAAFKNNVASRIAMIGYYPNELGLYSLYLADHDKPLALCGKTLVKGAAYLPKAGVKRAYIEGQSFVGSQLISGDIRQSQSRLPAFNEDMLANIERILNLKSVAENDSSVVIENDLSGDDLYNSFKNPALVISSKQHIRISNGSYSGNIAIVSDKEIVVSESAQLKDIILAAPRIIFEHNFKGSLQAFATDSIIVHKDVHLQYPSVLGIIKNKSLPKVSAIVLNDGDRLSGNIFVYNKQSNNNEQVLIKLHKESVVVGRIYSAGAVDAKGQIKGSLLCDKLILNTPSSVYENHLLNAEINIVDLSENYVGINLLEESTVKKVVKWLN